jgi:hypothetical protein
MDDEHISLRKASAFCVPSRRQTCSFSVSRREPAKPVSQESDGIAPASIQSSAGPNLPGAAF